MSLDVSLTEDVYDSRGRFRDTIEVFDYNITHNLTHMAKAAGVYEKLWYPLEAKASELVDPLVMGIKTMVEDKERLIEFNPDNGWGNYDTLLEFMLEYLKACLKYPDAAVRICR